MLHVLSIVSLVCSREVDALRGKVELGINDIRKMYSALVMSQKPFNLLQKCNMLQKQTLI